MSEKGGNFHVFLGGVGEGGILGGISGGGPEFHESGVGFEDVDTFPTRLYSI
jgi:hypothetical protein